MIKKNHSMDRLFDELGLKRMRESYMLPEEQSPQDRFAYVSNLFGSEPDHRQRLYDYASKHWLSYSSPILSMGRNKKGLPISCFLVNVVDTAEGLVDAQAEAAHLSMLGGGLGIGLNMRSSDEKSTGAITHLKVHDAQTIAYRQGKTRRGSTAAYLDIHHPDILNFLEIRKPTGDPNMRCLNIHHGVNITDNFMEIIENCLLDENYPDDWELYDPHNKEVKNVVSARELWERIISLRVQTGEPYIHFIDRSNDHLPIWLKNNGMSVKQSNLCSEIVLPTDAEHTAVCCLSSLNLEYYDEWKGNENFLRDVAEMLDNVLDYFIAYAPSTISKSIHSATNERSIGVGALGFHAYLQKNNIPWESAQAVGANKKIFKHIQKGLERANKELANIRGEAPYAKGTGKRFSHMMAVAPNATTSIIMGNTSPSIEPYRANVYRQDTISGYSVTKNKFLDAIIRKESNKHNSTWYDNTWNSIIENDGSVQHLKWMTDWQRDVFKTAIEIDQRWIIQHACDRQEHIDQSQSVNLFFRPDSHVKYVNATHFMAWRNGLKTLYYCRSEKVGRADRVSRSIERKIIKELNESSILEGDCIACEG